MSELEQKSTELLNRLENLAEQYTPEVIDMAMSAVLMTGIADLVSTFFWMAFSVIWLFMARKFYFFCAYKEQYGDSSIWDSWDWDLLKFILYISLSIPIILLIVGINLLTDLWTWIAIFNPKLALAHQLLGL